MVSLPLSPLFSWAVRHLRGWRSISTRQLPVPIPVPTAEDPSKRIAALCLDTREHIQQLVVMLGVTHQLVVVTRTSLAGWVTAAAAVALCLRTLPHGFAILADSSIPHTFPPQDHFKNKDSQWVCKPLCGAPNQS